MKYKYQFIGTISIFIGILSIIFLMIDYFVISEEMLNYTNEKYEVAEALGITQSDMERVVCQMISYISGKNDNPQVQVLIEGKEDVFYTARELSHLADVRDLYIRISRTMWICLLIASIGIAYLLIQRRIDCIVDGIDCSWIILMVFSVIITVVALMDTNWVVNLFHRIAFDNENWVLNPVLHRSVWMFRSVMYMDIIKRCLAVVFGIAVITISLKLIFRFFTKHNSSDANNLLPNEK